MGNRHIRRAQRENLWLHKAEPEIGCYGDVFIAFAEGKINFEYEEDCKTAKGNWQHRQVQVRVAPGCEDTLSHVYIATLDISKHKMMEEQLKEYQMHLEELVERRSVELLKTSDKLREQIKQRIEFTRALVHDLKTPLTPMMAASGTIAAGIKDEPWKSLSTRIYRGTLSLSKRINELLDLTKGDLGMLELSCESVETSKLMYELYELFKPEASQRRISLISDIESKLPCVWADEERLKQIMLNLLDNAFKFTPDNGVITMSARLQNSSIIIEVQDSGIGMTPNQQKKIFKPYERIVADRERLSGLGLGLALSKNLIELHGGRIWLKSKKGKGSIFSFTLPIGKSARKYTKKRASSVV
jgi:signal transduction histidine kinase